VLLELEDGTRHRDPDAATIASALRTLDGENNSFAILSEADEVYVQTAGGRDTGFVLEYREGSADAHYRAVRNDLNVGEVVRAFIQYTAGDPSWRVPFDWKRLEMRRLPSRRGGMLILIGALALVAVALLILTCMTP